VKGKASAVAEVALDVTLRALGGPSYDLVTAIFENAKKAGISVSADRDPSDIVAETERVDNEMQRLEAQARVAQEMAIALRIQGAAEVQIEEYYDYAGEGKVGLGTDQKGFTLGASGAGRRISKRVYKFTGSLTSAHAGENSDNNQGGADD
jgi:hypothetical protein